MIAATGFHAETMSLKEDIKPVDSDHLDKHAITTIPRVQTPDCDRSTDAAPSCIGAVRGRSFRPSPVACRSLGLASFFALLTPARWPTMKLAGQSRPRDGLGRAVASATDLQPICNRHPIEITVDFSRLRRLRAQPSRVTRVGVCVRTCAYARARNVATLQPHTFPYVYHMVIGCRLVANRLHLQPLRCAAAWIGRGARFRHILRAGYRRARCAALRPYVLTSLSTVLEGRGGESFGVFGLAGRRDRADLLEVGQTGGNGGFLRVSRGGSALVGRAMLEGCSQGTGNAALSGIGREPLRLGSEGTRGSIGPATPPMPPSPATPSPSTLAHARGRIWIGFGPALSRHDPEAAGRAQNLKLANGSGCRRPGHSRVGKGYGGASGKLRRMGDASGRCGHVN